MVLWGRDFVTPFFRAVAVTDPQDPALERDLSSNAASGKRRRWPANGSGEDAADHHALSCFDTLEQAMSNALAFDHRRRRGASPRWNSIARFTIDPHEGHVYADTFEDGHWSVWADAESLTSRVEALFPIPAQGPTMDDMPGDAT